MADLRERVRSAHSLVLSLYFHVSGWCVALGSIYVLYLRIRILIRTISTCLMSATVSDDWVKWFSSSFIESMMKCVGAIRDSFEQSEWSFVRRHQVRLFASFVTLFTFDPSSFWQLSPSIIGPFQLNRHSWPGSLPVSTIYLLVAAVETKRSNGQWWLPSRPSSSLSGWYSLEGRASVKILRASRRASWLAWERCL